MLVQGFRAGIKNEKEQKAKNNFQYVSVNRTMQNDKFELTSQKQPSKRLFSINNHKNNKNNNVNFGEIVTGTVLAALAIYTAIMAGTAAFFMGTGYAIMKIEEAVDARRKRSEERVKAKILKDQAEMAKMNPGMSKREVAKIFEKRLKRVIIEPTKDGKEVGLNKVIGFADHKYNICSKILAPLCEVMDGNKRKHLSVPHGLSFFGPNGTGKTHLARGLCEHYKELGGHFEKLNFVGNDEKDIKYLDDIFNRAEKKFIDSGKTKYTMLFLDEAEKNCNKDNLKTKSRNSKLLELADNCKEKGVILVTTSNDLQSVEPGLLRDGRTDYRIPVGHMEDFEVADLTNYLIKKYGIPADNIDYKEILDTIKTNDLKYKPKEIEKILNVFGRKLETGYLTTDMLKEALKKHAPIFNDIEQKAFKESINYAKKIGGLF